MYLKSLTAACAVLALVGCTTMHNEPPGAQPLEEQSLATQAADVLQKEMQQSPDKRIPQALIASARCIAVFPKFTKAAFIVGGASGNGIVACRDKNSQSWHNASPAFYTLRAGSVGFQWGIQSSGVVLLFLTQQGVNALTQNNVKLGADIGIAAGPIGWNASVTGAPAAVVSYQVSSKGLFAGISLSGSVLNFDRTSTGDVYNNKNPDAQQVLFQMNKVPSSVDVYNQQLAQLSSATQQQSMMSR